MTPPAPRAPYPSAAGMTSLRLPPGFMPEDVGGPKGFRTFRPVLAHDEVRCVGDRVAFVVAETEAQARDAAELIEIDYEALPAVVSVEDAVKAGAPAVWAECPGNVSFTLAFVFVEALIGFGAPLSLVEGEVFHSILSKPVAHDWLLVLISSSNGAPISSSSMCGARLALPGNQ